MSPAERDEFIFDPKIINWEHCTFLYMYGMQKHILGIDDVVSPSLNQKLVITKNQRGVFGDIKFAF